MLKTGSHMALNIDLIRAEFPALNQKVYGKDLIYLDNGATSQKPQAVLDALQNYYEKENANIHRGVHYLSQIATTHYEDARKTVQKYIHAKEDKEIIFTRGTTESINLLAFSLGELLTSGDEVLISEMEHHSNIVPWQMLCERKGCLLRVIKINERGELDRDSFIKLLNARTKIISITHVSNSLGTVNPIKELINQSRTLAPDAFFIVDGAQSIQHLTIDVQELDCDFFVFSGHKVFGPTGIGVLYGKQTFLEKMPPYQGGGDMIDRVTFEKTTYNELPFKFEAGTPHIAGAIGLAAALEYLTKLDREALQSHENALLHYAEKELLKIPGLRIIGTAATKTSVLSFISTEAHPFDIGTLLDKQGIAVRTGHHCTQPLMDLYQIPGTVRASFAFYNTFEEIDRFITALKRSLSLLTK